MGNSITDAIKRLNNPDVREEHHRELYGDTWDDYIRKLVGRESYYDKQERLENERYWADYYKNTGIDPTNAKYPIRMGIQNNEPIQTMPGIGISTGKRAINQLYGGQK